MKYQFICDEDQDRIAYWNTFKAKLAEGDVVELPAYEDFAFGLLDLQEKLEFCRDLGVGIYEEQFGLMLNPARELETLYYILTLKNESHREKQLQGIQDALRLKEEGKGAYGRPLAVLPKGFEERIIRLKKEHKPLEAYRRMTGMKKSTFYKYAKVILARESERAKAERAERLKAAAAKSED